MFVYKGGSLHKEWNTVSYFARASVMKKKGFNIIDLVIFTNTEAEMLEHFILKSFTGWSNVCV
jgi:hypothetical protein